MASTPFASEKAPAGGQQGPGPGVARARGLLAAMLVAGAALALGALVTPFHYYDALVVIGVAIDPALIVLAVFAGLAGRLAAAFASKGPRWIGAQVIVLLLGLAVAVGNVALWLNQRLDTSPAAIRTVPVVETWTRRSRSTVYYMADVATDVPSPLGRWSFYGSQPIEVDQRAYARIVPGRTRFVLRTHRGFLHFPWFEPDPQQLD